MRVPYSSHMQTGSSFPRRYSMNDSDWVRQTLHEIMRGYFGDVRTDPDAGNERGAI